jgi:hypothetical protein
MFIPPTGGVVVVGVANDVPPSSRLPRRERDDAFMPPKVDPADPKLLVAADSSSANKVPSNSQRSRIRLRNTWRKELQYGMR